MATDDTYATNVNTPLTIAVADLLSNDTDPELDTLSITSTQNPVSCTATLNGADIDFTPGTDFIGDATFEYVVDDGNGNTDVGLVTVTVSQQFATVAPVLVSNAVACTTAQSDTGRKVAIDGARNIYAAMICGTDVQVVVSTDLGVSFALPQVLAVGEAITEVAVQGGPADVAYLAVMTTAGEIQFSRTTDTGTAWSALASVDTGLASDSGISVSSSGDSVYIAGSLDGATLRAYRETTQGAGAFSSVDVTQDSVFFDVVVDGLNGDVWLVSDTPDYHLSQSNDGAASFMAEANPPGNAYYSDWATGNGLLYVSGSAKAITLDVIPLNAPTTSSSITGLGDSASNQSRALSASDAGTVYVVTQTVADAVQLDHALMGSAAIDDTVTIADGSNPSNVALPGVDGTAIVFTDGTDVYVAVHVFAP